MGERGRFPQRIRQAAGAFPPQVRISTLNKGRGVLGFRGGREGGGGGGGGGL